jgi:fumarate reductase (CoM/CoB) subunit A
LADLISLFNQVCAANPEPNKENFMSPQIKHIIKTDVLVLGGGAAGLRAAIEARRERVEVCVVSTFKAGYSSNSAISHGGFSAVNAMTEKEDSPQLHYEDTMRGGCGINRPFLVRILTETIWEEVETLEKMGVRFLKDSAGGLLRVARGGHSQARRLATPKNSGMNLILPLLKYKNKLNIKELGGLKAVNLLTSDSLICGVLLIDKEGNWFVIEAKAVVLATGGGGAIYSWTTNVPSAVGGGYALAYEAGLRLQDMEFVQFVVSNLKKTGTSGRLPPCETLLMKGAVLRNAIGENLFDTLGIQPIFTRDVIAQVVHRAISSPENPNNFVYLDVSTLSQIDLGVPELPLEKSFMVAPCSHFFMGGVRIEKDLTTAVHGLFAAGEVMGGVHGANRLGGNALAETLVFGAIAGKKAALSAKKRDKPAHDSHYIACHSAARILERFGSTGKNKSHKSSLLEVETEFKNIMSSSAGIIRNHDSMLDAIERLYVLRKSLFDMPPPEGRTLWKATSIGDMLLVGEMVLKSALKREESRGAHCRDDFPQRNDNRFKVNICVNKSESGEMVLSDVACQ